MKYHNITKCDVANGQGCRVVLWVSGCEHHCTGCHNPQTHDPTKGHLFTTKVMESLLEALKHPYIQGLTLSGGDPMHPANRSCILKIVDLVKEQCPDKDIWLYTGYTIDEIMKDPILKYVDVIVDGKYEEDKRDITLAFRGSSNQNIWRHVGCSWVKEIDYDKSN